MYVYVDVMKFFRVLFLVPQLCSSIMIKQCAGAKDNVENMLKVGANVQPYIIVS